MPVLRSIGQNPTEEEILNLVIEYDVNGDGTIDFEEFLEMMMKHSKGYFVKAQKKFLITKTFPCRCGPDPRNQRGIQDF